MNVKNSIAGQFGGFRSVPNPILKGIDAFIIKKNGLYCKVLFKLFKIKNSSSKL